VYRGISNFKKGYHPRTNIAKMGKVILLQTRTIFWLGRGTISPSFECTVHGVNDVTQTEHTAEPLGPEPSALETEMAVEKLKRPKSPGIDQIATELIKAEGRTFRCEIHKLSFRFGVRRDCLRSGRSRSLYLFISRVMNQIVVIIEAYHLRHLRTKFYPTSCCQGSNSTYKEITGAHQFGFRRDRSTVVIYSAFVKYLRKNGNRVKQCSRYL